MSVPTLGLRANLPQFTLLVIINAFVGAMVGLQRTIVPLLGEREFHVASATLATSFIISFGIVKALANLISGPLADRAGRKPVLVLGWLLGVPVPFILIWAPSLGWIIAANILLGLNQGLAWSMTVVMKIDLVGPARRGLALGINECAGYLAVGITAWATGFIAAEHGLRPWPLAPGIAFVALGLLLSVFFIRDTTGHAVFEAASRAKLSGEASTPVPSFKQVFAMVTWKDPSLFAASQAGLINNFNDGVAWGILPLLLSARGLNLRDIGLIVAAYPLSWGLCQLVTGALSDRIGRRGLIASGMWVQALGHLVIGLGKPSPFVSGLSGCLLLGIGTAMVYPTLLAAVSDRAAPVWRARALSVYRFWRDSGYAIGALSAGVIADTFGLAWSIHVAGALTFLSGVIIMIAMRPSRPAR